MQTGLNRLIAGFERVNDVTCWVGRQLAWLLVVLMTAAVLLQVFYRYVLVNPIGWSEELAIYSMIWMTFLVAPIAYRSGANVAIEVVRDLFVGRWQAALQIVLNLLVLVLLIIALYGFIVVRSLYRLMRERDPFIRLAGTGLACTFGVQAMINLGVAVRLLPAKGMTLPFVSYGGSSLIAGGIAVGMLLAFTRTRPQGEIGDILRGRAHV